MELLRRGTRDDAPGPGAHDPSSEQGVGDSHRGVRCPKCAWRPREHDRWACVCGTAWNTFETHGRCPGCGFQWVDTACLACSQWSPHEDWYER